jgi:hypothetical protein
MIMPRTTAWGWGWRGRNRTRDDASLRRFAGVALLQPAMLIAAGFPIPRKEFATGENFAGLATGVSCSRDSCILQIVAAEIDICAGDTSAVGAHQRDGH